MARLEDQALNYQILLGDALALGRRAIGFEIKPDYVNLIEKRMAPAAISALRRQFEAQRVAKTQGILLDL